MEMLIIPKKVLLLAFLRGVTTGQLLSSIQQSRGWRPPCHLLGQQAVCWAWSREPGSASSPATNSPRGPEQMS